VPIDWFLVSEDFVQSFIELWTFLRDVAYLTRILQILKEFLKSSQV